MHANFHRSAEPADFQYHANCDKYHENLYFLSSTRLSIATMRLSRPKSMVQYNHVSRVPYM